MRIRFVLLFILSMAIILTTSIITSYTSIYDAQVSFEKELFFIKELAADNQEIQKRISLYKAFSQKRAIDTTRRVWFVFFLDILLMSALFVVFLYGVRRPINKLSSKVKSLYFDKSEKELLLRESGTEEIRVLIRAFNEMVGKLKNYEQIIGNVNKYRGWKEISRSAQKSL